MGAAAATGSINLSVSSTSLSGWYNMNAATKSPGWYQTNIQGALYIGDSSHGYAEARSDGYPFKTLAGFTGSGRRNINANISAGDVRHAAAITVKACKTQLGPDPCSQRTYAY